MPVVKGPGFAPVFLRMAEPTPAPAGSASTLPPGPGKGLIFLRRLGSTVVLWACVLGALFAGPGLMADGLFLAVMLLIAVLGLIEFYALVEKAGLGCFGRTGILGGVLLVVDTFWFARSHEAAAATPVMPTDFEVAVLILFVLGLFLRQFWSQQPGSGIVRISTTLLGLLYVPWLLGFIQKLHFFPDVNGVNVDGNYYVLYFILVTKFSDLGAYVTGSLIGRHKMIPRISPGKTWEGFAGAIVISTGVSVAFAHFLQPKLYGMTLMHAVILGVLLSLAAVVGDLIESIFKREAKVKDSGSFFPGIGGILDLMDSLLFNAPLMYLYLRHIIAN